jgi:hypothetical protein
MRRFGSLLLGVVAGILLTFGFLWSGFTLSSLAESSSPSRPVAGTVTVRLAAKSILAETPSPAAGSDELPPPFVNAEVLSPNVLPTQIPGETLVYFTTTDSDATATVLVLYNTDSVTHTVALRGYSYNGVLGYSLNIAVPATSLVRLSSDSIVAAPPPSWATPPPIITNFTDFTYFGSLSLPKGVRVEGYALFNPGTGTVDPRLDQGAIPLRFSTDPATVFMPTVMR